MTEFKIPRHSFSLLLVALIILLILPTMLPEGSGLLFLLSWSGMLISGLWLVTHDRTKLIISLFLAVAFIYFGLKNKNELNITWELLSCIVSITFLYFVTSHTIRFLFNANTISFDLVYASICIYLLFGLIWAHIYLFIELVHPGSFLANQAIDVMSQHYGDVLNRFIYFSYVTVTTLGYGDITPVSQVASVWAMMEAIVGQFYIAVVVARLVGLQISDRDK